MLHVSNLTNPIAVFPYHGHEPNKYQSYSFSALKPFKVWLPINLIFNVFQLLHHRIQTSTGMLIHHLKRRQSAEEVVITIDSFTASLHSANIRDSKVHGANMGPSWADRTKVGPVLAPWICYLGLHAIRAAQEHCQWPWKNYGNYHWSHEPTMHCDTRQPQPIFRPTNHKRVVPAIWRPCLIP